VSSVSIEISGVDRLIAKLGRVEGTRVLREPMQRAVLRLKADMQEYPEQRPGSRYVRGRGMANAAGVVEHRTSQQLGKRWTSRIAGSGAELTGKVGNNVTYAPFVQSRQFQARVHRGRWQTDVQVMERNRNAIVGDFEAAIRRALR
jgi:hypothetical protein